MLEFANRPDRIFLTILYEAVESHCLKIQKILGHEAHGRRWQRWFPRLSKFFTASAALTVLARLLAASRAPDAYQLTDFHWLVLYDCLQRFCATLNKRAAVAKSKGVKVGPYWIGQVDFAGINERYFWDNDFLLGSVVLELGAEQRQGGNFDISDEAFSIAAGLPPHPHELRIERSAISSEWGTDEDTSPIQGFIPCYPVTTEDDWLE